MTHILVVEDEPDLRTVIEYNLQQAGYTTEGVGTGLAAQRAIARERPDLVVLDLMLPDIPGTEVCRELRRDARTRAIPVLMLTAKGDESSRVYGLEIGADDYLVKPASMRELVLRAGAVLRRLSDQGGVGAGGTGVAGEDDGASDGAAVLVARDVTLNVAERRAQVGDDTVALTALETRLLELLMSRVGRVQSRDALLREVWGDQPVSPRTVDMRIKRLRSRLGNAGHHIESVRGLGYRFTNEG